MKSPMSGREFTLQSIVSHSLSYTSFSLQKGRLVKWIFLFMRYFALFSLTWDMLLAVYIHKKLTAFDLVPSNTRRHIGLHYTIHLDLPSAGYSLFIES